MQKQRLTQQYTQRANLHKQDNDNNQNNTSNDILEYLPHQEMSNDHDNNNNSINNFNNETNYSPMLAHIENACYLPRKNQLIDYLVT